MLKTRQCRTTKLSWSKFKRAVRVGDQLQRFDDVKQEWYVSFTIDSERLVEAAFCIVRAERQLARVVRPAVVVAIGG